MASDLVLSHHIHCIISSTVFGCYSHHIVTLFTFRHPAKSIVFNVDLIIKVSVSDSLLQHTALLSFSVTLYIEERTSASKISRRQELH